MIKLTWNLIWQIAIFYLLLNLIIYFLADILIFPIPPASYQDKELPNFIKLKTAHNKKITAIYLENKNAYFTILVSHGNAEDLGSILPYLKKLNSIGFSILAYDYQGYGTSGGKPSEKNTYEDINAAYRYLTQILNINSQQIILLGRSLGTGPTLELASKHKVAGIILESPMMTASRVMTKIPFFILDKYRNDRKIKKVNVPILFIFGSQDRIIGPWHSQSLFAISESSLKQVYKVEGANHNDLLMVAGENYWKAIISFSNSIKLRNRNTNQVH